MRHLRTLIALAGVGLLVGMAIGGAAIVSGPAIAGCTTNC
jgi:hypothetical protein